MGIIMENEEFIKTLKTKFITFMNGKPPIIDISKNELYLLEAMEILNFCIEFFRKES